jgi:uracil-DNA glycosylase family 4
LSWKDKIRDPDCTLCPLHEEAEHVCLMGSGSRKSKIMIVGEAPGAREDETHQAFVGPAGALLTELLEEAGISRDECYITNIAKCRPPENRTPDWTELKICRDAYFWQEFEKVGPDYVLLLGNSAMRSVTGRSGITKHRGSVREVRGAQVLSTFHPAYVLRSPYHRPALAADIQRFSRMVRQQSDVAVERTKVKIVRNAQQLKWLKKQLMECSHNSYDIETYTDGTKNNFKEWHPDSKIVSIAFSWKVGHAVVVPLHHVSKPWKDPDRVLRYLKPCLERTDCKYIAHNGKYDCRWLASRGIFVPQTFDTMLAAHMLEENRPKGLKPLAQTLLGVDAWDIGAEVSNCYNENLRKVCIYNGGDTDYTLRLYWHFRKQLIAEPRIARVFAKLMMPASNTMTRVESIGPWVDKERYDERLAETIRKRDKVERRLRKSCGDINLRSPQQIAKWLFGDLGLPIIEETKSGAPSTNERVILRLAKQSPELRRLLEYRTLEQKYIRTYFSAWGQRDANDRVHPQYNVAGPVTGRLSGDFQQVPRDPFMRSIIGAPPGWSFVEADYSQVELRLAAWYANETRMLRLFASGEDAHRATAIEVSKQRPEDITPEMRKKAKGVNFGLLFGMGYKALPDYLFANYDVVMTEDEAYVFHSRWHETYPAFRKWHDRQRRLVRRYERVHSPIGRVRHLPTVRSSDFRVQADAERQAINSPIQSLASDIMLLSMVRLSNTLPADRAGVVLTVHDSIGFELRDDYVEEGVPLIRETMEDLSILRKKFGCDITVPITVEVKVGQHWGEGKLV